MGSSLLGDWSDCLPHGMGGCSTRSGRIKQMVPPNRCLIAVSQAGAWIKLQLKQKLPGPDGSLIETPGKGPEKDSTDAQPRLDDFSVPFTPLVFWAQGVCTAPPPWKGRKMKRMTLLDFKADESTGIHGREPHHPHRWLGTSSSFMSRLDTCQ